jgi:hypothetical protein
MAILFVWFCATLFSFVGASGDFFEVYQRNPGTEKAVIDLLNRVIPKQVKK